ncbi:MAG: DUF1802 family protein [SAR202 cluster bacterium]|nr:DUF1802 family protein [SAR202 cluster bacterium]
MLTLLPADSSLALKEWAVAVNALIQGKQILILRKGGIHKDDKEFRVVHPEFLLFPTYEHQAAELVKDAYHADLRKVIEENDVDGLITLSCFATVTDLYEVTDTEALKRISGHHIWTDDYAEKRLHWRPKQPLTIALLRIYKLTQPQALPILDEYAGCKSWVDLGQTVPMGQLNPIMSDADYEKRASAIRAALDGVATRAQP